MNRALPIVLAAILLPLAAAAQPPAAVTSGDPALDRAVKKANTDWIAAMHSGDAAREAAAYEDDAVFVALDGTAARGRTEIETMMKDRFAQQGLASSTKIEPRRVTREGTNLAVEVGTVEIRREGTRGQEAITSGSYLTVWRKQDDGSWKILRNLVLP
jgi:uncharacterized protein (TIGR02246 family)